MASIREQILLHVVDLLNGATVPDGLEAGMEKPAGLAVHRSRGRPIDKDALPASLPYEASEKSDRAGGSRGPLYRETLLLRIEHRVEGPKDAPTSALDPLITWAVQVLSADEKLGGLAHSVQKKGTAWDHTASVVVRETFGVCFTDFEIIYQTLVKNPEERS